MNAPSADGGALPQNETDARGASTAGDAGGADDGGVTPSPLDGGVTQIPQGYYEVVSATPGLVSYWRMVSGTGGLSDSKGSNHGTFVGSPSLNVQGALVGDPNAATRWSTGGDHAEVPDASSLDLGNGPFTLEAWVKRNDSTANTQTILVKGTNAYQFAFYDNKVGLFRYDGERRGDPLAVSTTSQTGGTGYHHYVVIKNGAVVNVYVDGIDVTGPVTDLALSDTTTALVVGGRLANEYLNGDLDEVAIYKVALDAVTVANHHRIGAGR